MTDRLVDQLREAFDKARWNGTDSYFVGTVQASFKKRSGKPMVVLEDDRGLLHVYPVSERLVLLPARAEATAILDSRAPVTIRTVERPPFVVGDDPPSPPQGAPAPGEDTWLHEAISAVADLPFSCSDCTVEDIVLAATEPALRAAHARIAEVAGERDEALNAEQMWATSSAQAEAQAAALRAAVESARDEGEAALRAQNWSNCLASVHSIVDGLTAALEGSAGTPPAPLTCYECSTPLMGAYCPKCDPRVSPEVARKLAEALKKAKVQFARYREELEYPSPGFIEMEISEALSLAEHGGR